MKFTQLQILKMNEMFEEIQKNIDSGIVNCVVSDINTFTDEKGNLLVSYSFLDKSDIVPQFRMIYVKFDKSGKRIMLNGLYAPVQLKQMFSKYERVKIE